MTRVYSEEDLPVLLCAVVGIAIGVVVGYFAYAVGLSETVSFRYWLQEPMYRGVIWWAIGGATVGGMIGYIRRD